MIQIQIQANFNNYIMITFTVNKSFIPTDLAATHSRFTKLYAVLGFILSKIYRCTKNHCDSFILTEQLPN